MIATFQLKCCYFFLIKNLFSEGCIIGVYMHQQNSYENIHTIIASQL